MGKYLRLTIINKYPINPARHLANTQVLTPTGTSLTICFPEYVTVMIAITKFMNYLKKHKSIALTPELVATFAIDKYIMVKKHDKFIKTIAFTLDEQE